jgi:hypothetical protein
MPRKKPVRKPLVILEVNQIVTLGTFPRSFPSFSWTSICLSYFLRAEQGLLEIGKTAIKKTWSLGDIWTGKGGTCM